MMRIRKKLPPLPPPAPPDTKLAPLIGKVRVLLTETESVHTKFEARLTQLKATDLDAAASLCTGATKYFQDAKRDLKALSKACRESKKSADRVLKVELNGLRSWIDSQPEDKRLYEANKWGNMSLKRSSEVMVRYRAVSDRIDKNNYLYDLLLYYVALGLGAFDDWIVESRESRRAL